MVAGKRSILWLALLIGGAGQTAAAELGVEFGVENFRWREFEAGQRLLEESGPRYRLGVSWSGPLGAPWRAIELRGALYWANLDYDGQACTLSGLCVPFQTDAEYLGVNGEAIAVRGIAAAGNGELFAGGGIDSWSRDVKGRDGVVGAVEDWTVFYLVAGAGARWAQSGARYRAQAGVKYPFYTHEVPDSFDVTLEPEGRVSFFSRLNVDFVSAGRPRWGLSLYYDSYRFAESDKERVGSVIIWQPESRQDTIGVQAVVYLR